LSTWSDNFVVEGDLSNLDRMLGARIRHRRRSQKLSLKDLAESSSISIGLLSQIERGLSSPSLRVLATIANALELGLADLFDSNSSDHAPTDKIVVRARERKKLTFWRTGISKELLTPQSEGSAFDMFLVSIDLGGTSGSQLYSHEGEEGGFVLEGSIIINVDGRTFKLEPGDSFRFASTAQHSFSNAGATAALVLWINTRPASPGPQGRR
jgi:transcriptional regulator with XRE-family HTH domain